MDAMTYPNLLVEQHDAVRVLTINRPDQLNALNRETIEALSQALDDAEADNATRAIVLTGSGEKAFVAGADIKEFAGFNVEQGAALSKRGHDMLFNKLERLKTPSIAAVNGYALGGGLELAMSCHIRVASTAAKMGLPEVGLGVIPGYGGTQRLAQLVGKGKAIEMIATAGMIGAEEAHQWGLANHVTAPEALMETALKLAGKIARNSPSAIAEAIGAVLSGYQDGVDGLQAEVDAFGRCFSTADFKEGTTAFMEKRKPAFTGS